MAIPDEEDGHLGSGTPKSLKTLELGIEIKDEAHDDAGDEDDHDRVDQAADLIRRFSDRLLSVGQSAEDGPSAPPASPA